MMGTSVRRLNPVLKKGLDEVMDRDRFSRAPKLLALLIVDPDNYFLAISTDNRVYQQIEEICATPGLNARCHKGHLTQQSIDELQATSNDFPDITAKDGPLAEALIKGLKLAS